MPRQNKEQQVTNALRDEGLKILGSDKSTSTEKMHWSKLLFDMQDVTKQELTVQFKQAEDRLDEAKSSLKETADALTAANAKVAELQPLADKAGELDTLRAENETWRAEQVRLLTADAQQQRFKGERAERAAAEKLHEADNKVAASGWAELRSTLAELISLHSVPMPSFWETSATMPSAFWTLWGWSPTKARIYSAYKFSYDSPNELFKQQVYKILTAGLPAFHSPSEYQPEIPDLGERRACLIEMAERFGCLREIQKRVDQKQTEILGEHLQQTASNLEAQQIRLSQQGYGRELINVQPEESATGCPPGEPHLEGCQCPIHAPSSRRTSIEEVI